MGSNHGGAKTIMKKGNNSKRALNGDLKAFQQQLTEVKAEAVRSVAEVRGEDSQQDSVEEEDSLQDWEESEARDLSCLVHYAFANMQVTESSRMVKEKKKKQKPRHEEEAREQEEAMLMETTESFEEHLGEAELSCCGLTLDLKTMTKDLRAFEQQFNSEEALACLAQEEQDIVTEDLKRLLREQVAEFESVVEVEEDTADSKVDDFDHEEPCPRQKGGSASKKQLFERDQQERGWHQDGQIPPKLQERWAAAAGWKKRRMIAKVQKQDLELEALAATECRPPHKNAATAAEYPSSNSHSQTTASADHRAKAIAATGPLAAWAGDRSKKGTWSCEVEPSLSIPYDEGLQRTIETSYVQGTCREVRININSVNYKINFERMTQERWDSDGGSGSQVADGGALAAGAGGGPSVRKVQRLLVLGEEEERALTEAMDLDQLRSYIATIVDFTPLHYELLSRLHDMDKVVISTSDSVLSQLSKMNFETVLRKVTEEGAEYPGFSSECSICLDPYEASADLVVLPCGHLFHIQCVESYLKNYSNSCPVCKAEVILN